MRRKLSAYCYFQSIRRCPTRTTKHNIKEFLAPRPVMMRSNIPLPPKLETKRNLAENWKIWKQIWESYEIVSNLVKQEDIYRVATFITCIGANALEIYNGLPFESEAHRKNMANIMELMEKHCIGTTNVTYERYI